jgi:aryl-alcohol dehydrogenase-like predicted oxidoreductase
VIIGASSVWQLAQNLAALKSGPSNDDLKRIDGLTS